jgi:hypothetical protein
MFCIKKEKIQRVQETLIEGYTFLKADEIAIEFIKSDI